MKGEGGNQRKEGEKSNIRILSSPALRSQNTFVSTHPQLLGQRPTVRSDVGHAVLGEGDAGRNVLWADGEWRAGVEEMWKRRGQNSC